MSNLNTENQHNYNDEPVVYCSQCLSLRIRDIDGVSYCDDCGNTDLKEANIHDWENLYFNKYSIKFLDKK